LRINDPGHGPNVCILTPTGRGAVAVARVWGPGALATADAAFRPVRGEGLAATPPRRPRLGRVGAGLGDEVVAVVFDGDPPEVEIQCHGGSAAVEMVVAALRAEGARLVDAIEYLESSESGPVRAAAWEDLARAATPRTAEVLLEQAQGALDREIDRLIARIEAEAEPATAEARLDELIARGRLGSRLVRGWRVVIAGRPNVGKSRLLNALAGYARAIVSPTPGTTRDALTVRTAFDGWPVELVDTAGVRESEDAVERSGVARALHERTHADLALHVLDRSRTLGAEEPITTAPRSLVVVNKADLPAAWDPAVVLPGAPFVVVSAETGAGLDDLGERIARMLAPDPPEPGAGVPFRAEQLDALAHARAALRARDLNTAAGALRLLVRPERRN